MLITDFYTIVPPIELALEFQYLRIVLISTVALDSIHVHCSLYRTAGLRVAQIFGRHKLLLA